MMPFHPCGAVCDFLRFTYESEMRLVEDQPPIKIRWLKCKPGAKPLPFSNPYGSKIWLDRWRTDVDDEDFGEILGPKVKWVEPTTPPASSCLKGPHWPERYRPGVSAKDALTYPVLRMDAEQWPICCCHPCQFWPTFRQCTDVMRYPQRMRVYLTTDGIVGGCTGAPGTSVIIDRQEDGIWRGEGFFGATGEPIQLVFPTNFGVFGECALGLFFTDHPGQAINYIFGPDAAGIAWSPNPVSITFEHFTGSSVSDALSIAICGNPLDLFRLHIVAYSFSS